jgi:hypothetical protein
MTPLPILTIDSNSPGTMNVRIVSLSPRFLGGQRGAVYPLQIDNC